MTDPSDLFAGQAAKDEDHQWEPMDGQGDDTHNASASTSSLGDPTVSNGSASSSSDMVDDASSSSTSSSSSSQPLYDLSELMAQLPIKRGLSKFYQGKSQSFTSLSRVTSIEELPKKGNPSYRRKTKASKSYGGGFDTYKLYTLPKPSISKKTSRGSLLSSSFPNRRGSFLSRCSEPL